MLFVKRSDGDYVNVVVQPGTDQVTMDGEGLMEPLTLEANEAPDCLDDVVHLKDCGFAPGISQARAERLRN